MFYKVLLYFLFSVSFCVSQQKRKLLHGVVSDNLGPLASVHVVNKTTRQATVSLNEGDFEVYARVGDVLQFTYVGYKTKTIDLQVVHFGIQTNEFKLEKDIIQLDEVEVKNHNLSGVLSADVNQVQHEQKFGAKALKLPYQGQKKLSSAERKLNMAKGGTNANKLGLFSSVSLDWIINSISGRLKRARLIKEFEDKERDVESLHSALNLNNYVRNHLNILPEDTSRFIDFCLSDKQFVTIRSSEILYLEFLRSKAIEFKTINSYDTK